MIGLGGWLILAGSVIFLVGAAIGVPRVFMVPSGEERLRVLEANAGTWRLAQWPYAVGPVTAALGVLVLGVGWAGRSQLLAGAAGAAMLVGALFWSVSCARRGRRIREFALGLLPSLAWEVYVWLTLAGLALLGLSSLGFSLWAGIGLLLAAAAFTVLLVVTRDIPPFVFYVTLIVFGTWVLIAQPR